MNAFVAAVNAYRDKFSRLPQTANVVREHNIGRAVEALKAAVERGEPLGEWGLALVLGYRSPGTRADSAPSPSSRAAGIMLLHKVKPLDKVLFLQRRTTVGDPDSYDHPGEWCFPGGTLEDGETVEQAALRETEEEIGPAPFANPVLWTRTAGEVDYTTFLAHVTDEFIPRINEEHQAYTWAPVDAPPEPLHPGCRIALARLGMDELGIARAICRGDLTSPQRYENVWLFALRITGTGASYRDKHQEHVWRPPEIYLTDEFLARCNGLPVIIEHPGAMSLNTEEYRKRNIGSIFLPYIKDDEVWGVAKIWDHPAAELMAREQLSTSPSVDVPTATSLAGKLEDGSNFMIEGDPSLVDHLAICRLGVWDKGGEPTGVDASIRQDDMDIRPAFLAGLAGRLAWRAALARVDSLVRVE